MSISSAGRPTKETFFDRFRSPRNPTRHAFVRLGVGSGRFRSGDALGVLDERGREAGGEVCDGAQRAGVLERGLEFGVDGRVGLVSWRSVLPTVACVAFGPVRPALNAMISMTSGREALLGRR
jgi:hypothetical protein